MLRRKAESLEISRREFARRAGMAAFSAACLPSKLADAGPQPEQLNVAPLSPESQAEGEAKVRAILRKYGARFSEDQTAEIRRLVTEGQKPLDAMRQFPLENSDQPANVMKVYPDSTAARHNHRA